MTQKQLIQSWFKNTFTNKTSQYFLLYSWLEDINFSTPATYFWNKVDMTKIPQEDQFSIDSFARALSNGWNWSIDKSLYDNNPTKLLNNLKKLI